MLKFGYAHISRYSMSKYVAVLMITAGIVACTMASVQVEVRWKQFSCFGNFLSSDPSAPCMPATQSGIYRSVHGFTRCDFKPCVQYRMSIALISLFLCLIMTLVRHHTCLFVKSVSGNRLKKGREAMLSLNVAHFTLAYSRKCDMHIFKCNARRCFVVVQFEDWSVLFLSDSP